MIGGPGSVKRNTLLNLISQQPDIDKFFLYAEDQCEAKYQLQINKREYVGLKYCNDSKALTEYSNDMDDIYKHFEDYNSDRKCNV